MSLIDQLKKRHDPPAYAETLLQFSRRSVAEMVGISTGYLCNILTGSKPPSDGLDKALRDLAKQIEMEMETA